MNFDNWEYRESELPKDKKEKEAYFEKLKEKFLLEIKSSKAVQDWLQQFDERFQEDFLQYYVSHKTSIIQYSNQYIRKAEQVAELKHREYTQKTLALVLQKKLFDLQCRWRAEQITLPGIRISWDFWYWAQNIFNCPFLDPVTDSELDTLQRYIQTDNFDPEILYTTGFGWQYYDEIRSNKEEETDDEVTTWYDFYDVYMGTSMLQLLPDIRGQKEKVYYEAVRQKEAEEQRAAGTVQQPHVPKPFKEFLFYSVHRCYEVACLFDDPYFVTLMKANSEENALGDTLENKECDAYSYMVKLENIPDLPPVRGGVSWRMALQYCYVDYLKIFIAKDLPAVCEEYQLYRSMNLLYTLDDKEDNEKRLDDFMMSNSHIEKILKGRALLGEPEDLNF